MEIDVCKSQRDFFDEQVHHLGQFERKKTSRWGYERCLLGEELTCSRGAVVSQLLGDARKKRGSDSDEIIRICESLLLLDHWGAEFANDYLKRKGNRHHSGLTFNPSLASSPRLDALLGFLRDDEHKDCVILILVDGSRTVVDMLVQILKEKLCRPILRLIGHGKRNGMMGMTWEGSQQQQEVLRSFGPEKDGKVNILVSTTVLEEGIDICECDRVVLFCGVARSETSFLQICGRARKPDSQAVTIYNKWETKRYQTVINPSVMRITTQLRTCHKEEAETQFAMETNSVSQELFEKRATFVSKTAVSTEELTGVFIIDHSLYALESPDEVCNRLVALLRMKHPNNSITTSRLLSQMATKATPGVKPGSSYCFMIFSIIGCTDLELDEVDPSLLSPILKIKELVGTTLVLEMCDSVGRESTFSHLTNMLWENHLRRDEACRSAVKAIRRIISRATKTTCNLEWKGIDYDDAEPYTIVLRYQHLPRANGEAAGPTANIKEILGTSPQIDLGTETESDVVSLEIKGTHNTTSLITAKLIPCKELGARVTLKKMLKNVKDVQIELSCIEATCDGTYGPMYLKIFIPPNEWELVSNHILSLDKALKVKKDPDGSLDMMMIIDSGDGNNSINTNISRGDLGEHPVAENIQKWLLLVRWLGDASNLFDSSPLSSSDDSEDEVFQKERLRHKAFKYIKDHVGLFNLPPTYDAFIEVLKTFRQTHEEFKKHDAIEKIIATEDIYDAVYTKTVELDKMLQVGGSMTRRFQRNPEFFKLLFKHLLGLDGSNMQFEIRACAVWIKCRCNERVKHELEELRKNIITCGIEAYLTNDAIWTVITESSPLVRLQRKSNDEPRHMVPVPIEDCDISTLDSPEDGEKLEAPYAEVRGTLKERMSSTIKDWLKSETLSNKVTWLHLKVGRFSFTERSELCELINIKTDGAGKFFPADFDPIPCEDFFSDDHWASVTDRDILFRSVYGNIFTPCVEEIDYMVSLKYERISERNAKTALQDSLTDIYRHKEHSELYMACYDSSDVPETFEIYGLVSKDNCDEICEYILAVADDIKKALKG
eukprot:TRINITY_DN9632_c2_g1_i2.p1 TRINITY_DN9632_c2_g1~~TRINITY_DN9632_c2_g1_i2.p1  ORF type:complete len:1060 (+),score=189.87 TRINITY_DN9632_c2_g1_i2:1618-4797(+)